MKKNKSIPVSFKISFAFFVFLYLLYHLVTLSYNPLPWFDETYFASISLNFKDFGTFIPQIANHAREGEESLTYGPVYFTLASLFFKLFGFGIFQFRLVALISGLLCIMMTALILKRVKWDAKPKTLSAFLLAVVFLMDPFFNLSMHEGRMDTTAILFSLIAFWFILKEKTFFTCFFSGLAAALALLTTPRSGIILAGLFIALLFSLKNIKDLRFVLYWIIPILLVYTSWIFYAFGGFYEWIIYYLGKLEGSNAANHAYLGGRFYIPKHEYLLISIAIIAFVYGIIQKNRRFFNVVIIAAVTSIVLFYFLILDWGPYSVFIIPFYYLIIFYALTLKKINFRNPVLYLAFLLFAFNFSYSTLKIIQVFSDLDQKDPLNTDLFIQVNIPKGSKVVSSGMVYYAILKAGSDMQFYDKFDSHESREKKLRALYDYDYLIVPENESGSSFLQIYFENAKLEKIAELKTEPSPFAQRFSSLGLLSKKEDSGYNMAIYKRIKE